MTDFPTARTMLPNDSWLCLSVRCHACLHRALADLQAIVDAGRGDVPVKDLKFRCTGCGSRRTSVVVTSRDAQRVQPWRAARERAALNWVSKMSLLVSPPQKIAL
jgi:hypothetical protein